MKKILAAKPSISELEIQYVTDAVKNGWGENCYDYVLKLKEITREYFCCGDTWPTSSCHGALHMALMALGVKPEDEVIVPRSTWVGSVFPISWLGANPVFVDSLSDTWCIDPKAIERAMTPKTKAIIAVHLYGNLCEMDEIMAIGEKFGVPVIEDAAEAIGSEYKGRKAGGIGDFGVFSFHGTKTLTTGEGGLLTTNRIDLVEKVNTIDSQGRKKGAKLFWVDEIGLKYKMSNLQAALGVAQFERVEDIVNKKREIFSWYQERIGFLEVGSMNIEQDYAKNSYWMPTLVFNDPNVNSEMIIQKMNSRGIAVRPFFYDVDILPMYRRKNVIVRNHKGINFPSYGELTKDDVMYICNIFKDCYNQSSVESC